MEQNQDLGQLLGIVKRRKPWLIWPFVAVVVLTTIVAVVLPDSFKSTATILIQNQQIPSAMVPSTVTTFAEERIQSISQEVTARTKVLNLVNKYDLLPEKRENLPTEDLVEKIRKRITIQPINAEINKEAKGRPMLLTIAFSLSYEDESARKAQAVTNEIASYFMEKNLESRSKVARGTSGFLEEQLKQEKAHIDQLEERRAEYRKAHLEELPEFTALNMQKLEKLNANISDLHMQIRTLESQRATLRGQMALVDPYAGGTGRTMSPSERLQQAQLERAQLLSKYSDKHPLVQAKNQEVALLEGDVKGTAKPDQMVGQLRELEGKLAGLQGKYTDLHPEVQSVKREIEKVKREMSSAQGRKGAGGRVEAATNPAYVGLKADLEKIDVSIGSYKAEIARLDAQMKDVYAKLQAMPEVAKDYNEVETEYQIAKAHYNEIQQKLLAARTSQGMEEEQLGESFNVVEPAFLPEKPFKPNRLAIALIGVVLGIGFSVGAAALREFSDQTVRDVDAVETLAGVPVLSVIPRIVTREELIRAKRRRMAGAATAAVALVVAVAAFHYLVMDLYVFYAKVERFIQRKVP
jgi:polysaccharide biosynthesis transport protein